MSAEAQSELRYRAFISYSRVDRLVAERLQHQLELFVLPAALRIVSPGLRHDSRPLRPIFRDESELVPGQDLPARIMSGLQASQYLLVVCSPAATRSEWVTKEVTDFIAIGRRDFILAVVVGGEPNAARRGLDPALECLPAPLREGPVGSDGRPSQAEPLWVDWRGPSARDRKMFLRIVAALLSLRSLDDLVRRDHARQRRRRYFQAASAVASAAVISAASWLYVHELQLSRARRSSTLVGLAEAALNEGHHERAARYGLLAMKGFDTPLIGFDPSAAERVLLNAMLGNRRMGPPEQIPVGNDDLVAFSPDGRFHARLADSGKLTLLDLTAKPPTVRTLMLEPGYRSLAISPDNRVLAAARELIPEGYQIQLWDLTTGAKLGAPLVSPDEPSALFPLQMVFSPDGQKLGLTAHFADGGGDAHLWDLAGRTRVEVDSSWYGIGAIAISADGRFIATAGFEGTQVLEIASLKPIGPRIRNGLDGGSSIITALAFDPSGASLAIASSNGSVIKWDLSAQREDIRKPFRTSDNPDSLRFSPDGSLLAAKTSAGAVHIWGRDDDHSFILRPGGDFSFLSNGQLATVAGSELRLWQLSPPLQVDRREIVADPERFRSAAFSKDGDRLAVEAASRSLQIYDLGNSIAPTQTFALQGPDALVSTSLTLAFSPVGNFVARAHANDLSIFALAQGTQRGSLEESLQHRAIAFSPNGALLASFSEGSSFGEGNAYDAWGEIRIWDVASGRQVAPAFRTASGVMSIAFSPDGRTLVGGVRGKPVQFFDMATMQPLPSTITGTDTADFSRDGKLLVTSDDRQTQWWSIAEQKPVGKSTPARLFFPLIQSRDGRLSLSGSSHAMRVVDTASGLPVGPSLLATGYISAAWLSSDERLFRIVSGDGNLATWNVDALFHLRGRALIARACNETVPGRLSLIEPLELDSSPVLDTRSDADACRP